MLSFIHCVNPKKVHESSKNLEMSSMGEELMERLQRELDQNEQLDQKLLSHLNEDRSAPRGDKQLGGRLQQLLEKVHEEGLNVLQLSEYHLNKSDTESEKQKYSDINHRRIESQLDQEKLLNRDLSDALQRERQRIHDQEKRSESDRQTVETLQHQIATSRYVEL